MQSIQTFYNGTYYRSRLEARWAVFFDEMKIPFEYEPKAFKLKDKYTYIPDFCLLSSSPDTVPTQVDPHSPHQPVAVWIEVKPKNPTNKEAWKVETLSRQLPETEVFFFIGQPTKPFASGHGILKFLNGEVHPLKQGMVQCPKCGYIGISTATQITDEQDFCPDCQDATLSFETEQLTFAYATAQATVFPDPPIPHEDTHE